MKRTKVVSTIGQIYAKFLLKEGISVNQLKIEKVNEFGDCVLKQLERLGMLPPTQAPSLIEDTLHGGQKHGLALRVWDEENQE